MMDSSADLGPSVHTICEARGGSSVSRIPMSFPARLERGGRRGKRVTHLGLALYRGRAREDILHLDVRHVDRGECDCCPARLSSETDEATTRLTVDSSYFRAASQNARNASGAQKAGGHGQNDSRIDGSGKYLSRPAKISVCHGRKALQIARSALSDPTIKMGFSRRRGLPRASGSTHHPARASSTSRSRPSPHHPTHPTRCPPSPAPPPRRA